MPSTDNFWIRPPWGMGAGGCRPDGDTEPIGLQQICGLEERGSGVRDGASGAKAVYRVYTYLLTYLLVLVGVRRRRLCFIVFHRIVAVLEGVNAVESSRKVLRRCGRQQVPRTHHTYVH